MQLRAVARLLVKGGHILIHERVIVGRCAERYQVRRPRKLVVLVQLQFPGHSRPREQQGGHAVVRRGTAPQIAVAQRDIYVRSCHNYLIL